MEKMKTKKEEEQQQPAATEILPVPGVGWKLQQQAGYRTGKRSKTEDEQPESLWGDLLPEIHREILSRVPYRSLCRFRCVSKAWLALCSDPAVRRRSPQTPSGFFCYSQLDVGGGQRREGLSFLNLSGWGRPLLDDPSLRFVRVRGYRDVTPLHCCGGILICYCLKAAMSDDADYVVCNPATEEIWAVLPVPAMKPMMFNAACLCFDPTVVPRCFKVFVFVQSLEGIQRVEVYSSETGQWTSMQSQWSHDILLMVKDSECAFFNGTLHLVADSSMVGLDQEGKVIRSMVTVDTEGRTWRSIRMPDGIHNGFIGQSKGRIYATRLENGDDCCLLVWVLEDYASGEWTLKCTASIPELLGRSRRKRSELYTLIAIHLECSLIFLVGGARLENTLISYDMDSGKLQVICALGNRQPRRFQPYVPCFVEKPPVAQ